MNTPTIRPDTVTRPIQLLAAWLVGLVLIDASFLTAASTVRFPGWAPGMLVISAVANVPLFLALIFFLQTKYRLELQEDPFYAKHLELVDSERTGTAEKSIAFLAAMASEREMTYYTPRDKEFVLNDALQLVVKDLYEGHKSTLQTELRKWIHTNDKNLLWLASEIVGFYEMSELVGDLYQRYKDEDDTEKWPQWRLNFIWAHSKVDNDYDELLKFMFSTQSIENKEWVVGALFQMIDKGYENREKLEGAIIELGRIEKRDFKRKEFLQVDLVKQQP